MNTLQRNGILIPSLMNEIFKPDWFGGVENASGKIPAANIKENEANFELALAVPGRDKADFTIEVDKDVLTISSDSKNEEAVENFTKREFGLSSFKRAFVLPKTIDHDKIEASYEQGILKLDLPKKEEALPRPKRSIELS